MPSVNNKHAGVRDESRTWQGRPAAGLEDLAVRLSELARDLQREHDAGGVLAQIVAAAVALIPGVDEASISLVTGRKRVESLVPSSDLPRRVDAVQTETGQGPCLDAVYQQQTVRVDDMRAESRWPLFGARAVEAGVGSMMSFQLYVENDNLGALNTFAAEAGAFDDESEHIGLLFAAHAAVAFAAVRQQQQLTAGLQSRDLIGQAKGMIMERYKVNGEQAFMMLTRLSQDANLKLRDVADRIVHGDDPDHR